MVSPAPRQRIGHCARRRLLQVARKEEAEFTQGKDKRLYRRSDDGQRAQGARSAALFSPVLANYTIVLPLGYGRRSPGTSGTGAGIQRLRGPHERRDGLRHRGETGCPRPTG